MVQRRAGRGLKSAGRAMEPSGRVPKKARRALELVGKALEPAGRPREWAEKKKLSLVCGGIIGHHPLYETVAQYCAPLGHPKN